MTTIEKVGALVAKLGPLDEPPADDQPLFYAAMLTNSDAHRAGGGYGLDSLDRVEVAMEIEEAFDLAFGDADTESLNTVADLAAFVDRKLEEKARAV